MDRETGQTANRDNELHEDGQKSKLNIGLLLASATGACALTGISATFAVFRRPLPEPPNKVPLQVSAPEEVGREAATLALRAFARGTLCACAGFGAFCYVIWKLMDVNNMSELRQKLQPMLPKISRNGAQEKTEFQSLEDFVDYLIDEDKKNNGKNHSN